MICWEQKTSFKITKPKFLKAKYTAQYVLKYRPVLAINSNQFLMP